MPSLEVDTTPAEETEDSNESIRLLAGAFTEAMQQIADRQADFEERALRYISIQDEELNMLWWLQGGRTQAGQLFEEIPREQQPFVLARDLAEATFSLPGASAIGSLLERAGIKNDEPLEVAAAIQVVAGPARAPSSPTSWAHRPAACPASGPRRRRSPP
jgi:GTPase-associated system helical domain